MNKVKKSLFTTINDFIDQHDLLPQGSTIVLGLSGGPDSVFLLHVLTQVQPKKDLTIIAAHLDHGWRNDSENDVAFCRNLAQKYNVPLVTDKLSNYTTSLKFNGSREELARRARRAFLETVAKKHNAQRITFAHHYNDQQETFFIRLLRGASLTGLTGMQPHNGLYVRPLLQVDKANIIGWLDKNNISYLRDTTNDSSDYLRNRIRNQVLPALRLADNRFDDTFGKTFTRLQETELFLQKQTESVFKSISLRVENKLLLKRNDLLSLEPIMQDRLLLRWLCAEKVTFTPSTKLFAEIKKFLSRPTDGTHAIYKTWSIVKKKNTAYICKSSKQS